MRFKKRQSLETLRRRVGEFYGLEAKVEKHRFSDDGEHATIVVKSPTGKYLVEVEAFIDPIGGRWSINSFLNTVRNRYANELMLLDLVEPKRKRRAK